MGADTTARTVPAATRTVARRVAGRFARYRGRLLASACLVLISVALNTTSPLLVAKVIDDALPHHEVTLLALLCGTMIAAGLCSSLISVAQGALTNWIGQRVVSDLRVDVYDRVRRMPLEFFGGHSGAEAESRLVSDIGDLSDVVTYTATSTLRTAASLAASVTVMFVLSARLAFISLALAVLLNVVNNRFAWRRRVLAGQRQDAVGSMMRKVEEDLSYGGVLLSRTMRQEARHLARFRVASERIRDLTYAQRVVGRTGYAIIGVVLACLPPVVYLLAGTVATGLTLGTVVVLATVQLRVSGPLQQLFQLSGTVQSSMATFERVFAYLDLEGGEPPAPLHPHQTIVPPELHVRGVSHVYHREDGSRHILTGVNLGIAPGSVTLVAGETGAGKSTLGLILAGLLSPSSGTVAVNGHDQPDARRLRDLVTLVPQEAVLFNTSIRENLLYGAAAARSRELASVLAAAHLTGLLADLPAGIDTTVGERGYQLSGGERQRVALARALLSPSPVLVLDEATSALDSVTAHLVHEAVRAYCHNRTLVIIAHRLPRMRPDDRVVVMAGGRIAEDGSHASLAASGGRYARLLGCQKTTRAVSNQPDTCRTNARASLAGTAEAEYR